MQTLAILVRFDEQPTKKPCERMNTSSIASWSERKYPVVYLSPNDLYEKNGQLWGKGWMPTRQKEGWEQKDLLISCIYNRFPLQYEPKAIKKVTQLTERHHIPFANHPSFQALVWDKQKTGQILKNAGIKTPKTYQIGQDWQQNDAKSFYLKPRFGAFGQGIKKIHFQNGRVIYEEPITKKKQEWDLRSFKKQFSTNQPDKEMLIQVAIEPPQKRLKGFSVRSLVQQSRDGSWGSHVQVARISHDDPVANVARGAKAIPLEDFLATFWAPQKTNQLLTAIENLNNTIPKILLKQESLSQQKVIEMGIDYLIDTEGTPWLLEINGFPQGKLEHLTKREPHRFGIAYEQTQHTPLERLSDWAKR